ncbi:MAG: NAD+ synthase [Clostridia bacterium]|nr:NAD+ synthase [Clostridia bacterium]
MRLALAQINSTVGDLEGNRDKILSMVEQAHGLGVDLLAFPELCLTGYPPEDLLLKPQFILDNLKVLAEIIPRCRGLTVILGFVDQDQDIYNAAAVIHDGQHQGTYRKMFLPNYGVFDEERYFRAGREISVFSLGEVKVGVNICEDVWYPEGPHHFQALAGASLIVNLNASPYHAGKREQREKMLATRALDNRVIVAYVNTVGGQDELVFDGQSFVVDPEGQVIARAGAFREELLVVDLHPEAVFRTRLHDPRHRKQPILPEAADAGVNLVVLGAEPRPGQKPRVEPRVAPPLSEEAEIYAALVVGTRDYVRKNGFTKVLLGLSGGIDSSLTAAIAADALGPENVIGVLMPSPYTSQESVEDALELARNLGLRTLTLSINELFSTYQSVLADPFRGREGDVTEENIQARIRGNLLMALSNKFGWLLLTTGNKSEMSVGYATLYGDMAGGFAVLKDVFKTKVYALARYRNSLGPVIPERVLTKAPSAELKPDQVDQDTLPPYPLLDAILEAYVEQDLPYEEILSRGFDPETVKRVIYLVDRSEYKRRQSPPGVKITPRALGKDRRMPITNRYRGF